MPRSVAPHLIPALAQRPTPPDSAFAVEEHGEFVAWVGVEAAPGVFATTPDDRALVGLGWAPGRADAGEAVIRAALAAEPAGRLVMVRTNAEQNPEIEARLAVLDACGFALYQEKRGYWWQHDPAHKPTRTPGCLLAAAAHASMARELPALLCEVDVHNGPMHEAMLRAGHRTGVRPWHTWQHRRLCPL